MHHDKFPYIHGGDMTHAYNDTTLVIINSETIDFYKRWLSIVERVLRIDICMLTTAIFSSILAIGSFVWS